MIMYVNAIKYKDIWLAPGSDALALYQLKEYKKLDELLAACDKTKRKMEGAK